MKIFTPSMVGSASFENPKRNNELHPFHEWIRSWFISVWNLIKMSFHCLPSSFCGQSCDFFPGIITPHSHDRFSTFFLRCTGTMVFTLCWSLNALCVEAAAFVIHKLAWCNVAQFCGNLNHWQAPNWRQHQSLACLHSQITAFAQ